MREYLEQKAAAFVLNYWDLATAITGGYLVSNGEKAKGALLLGAGTASGFGNAERPKELDRGIRNLFAGFSSALFSTGSSYAYVPASLFAGMALAVEIYSKRSRDGFGSLKEVL